MALENAISLLEKQVELQPTCRLHQMLGDLLARVHEEEKALDHYSIALKYVSFLKLTYLWYKERKKCINN